ncbi:MAG: T9SS type A sorting domain-containing protein [Chitinophagaceae bacterium]|nr:T9SS type A sorting domain-containing protein [Chitinophagaceae bacterium]
MKNLFLLISGVLLYCTASAQTQREKLSDIVSRHKLEEVNKSSKAFDIHENQEKNDYQFERWLWYWSLHTDRDGYIVPKKDAFELIQKYRAEQVRASAKSTADPSDWKAIGPYQQSAQWIGYSQIGIGRINTMGFHPTDPNEFIVGTAGGGAWRTKNGGNTWDLLTNAVPSPAISDIDYNPQNPNTIYICTGDKDAIPFLTGGKDYNSIGLIKSTDNGATWSSTGLNTSISNGLRTNGLLINPIDTNSLTLCTANNIMKSYNGGNTWTNSTLNLPNGHFVAYIPELVYNTADTAVIYAPVTTISQDIQGDDEYTVFFMVSKDGGATWNYTDGAGDAIRGAIAVTTSDPDIIKIVVANTDLGLEGIYESSDGGNGFNQIADDANCTKNILASSVTGIGCKGQGHYDLCIAIDPKDEDHVIVGGVNSWHSLDGGSTWSLYTQWANDKLGYPLVHADHHYLGYNPNNVNELYDCNDGGIAILKQNPLTGNHAWIDYASGMNITQYYRVATTGVANFTLGGAQDNGTCRIEHSTGISNPLGPGDGMDCIIDPVNPDIVYVASQNGNFFKWDLSKPVSTQTFNAISDNITNSGGGTWTAPIELDPNDHKRLIVGMKAVFASPDQGKNWQQLSDYFNKHIYRIALTKASSSTIYAIEDAITDTIHYTHDAGKNWSMIQHPYNEPKMSDLIVDHNNTKKIWVTFSGFGQNKNKVAMWNDSVWTSMDENLPDMPVYCILQDTSNGTLYIGNYIGVFYRTPKMTRWESLAINLPYVSVMDLEINYKTGELIAGTWGRGMWTTPKYEEKLSIPKGIPYAQDVISLYPNPNKGSFVIIDNDEYFKDKDVSIRLIDITGKTAWTDNGHFTGYKLNVSIDYVPTGSYIIELTGANGKVAKERILVQE